MISGIVPAQNFIQTGFPWELAIGSWADVCDEIVVVAPNDDIGLGALNQLASAIGSRCSVKVRGIACPKYFELFRFFGYFYCDNPDWVVHFDMDYIISPQQAYKLRKTIEAAPHDMDAMLYRLVYLNRGATRKVFNNSMLRYVPPYDGYHGDYPFVVNPRRQVFMSPMMAMMENGHYVDYEGIVSLRPGNWGNSLFMKYNSDAGFNVRNTGVVVEHLSYSLPEKVLREKLKAVHFTYHGLDYDYVSRGQEDYPVSYPALDQAREKFR